jgi:hypothetical protein
MAATIRCDPIAGEWQTLGTERYRGVVAEGIEASSNSWGPDRMSFTVKAVEAGAARPDLLPYTPLELEIDGLLCWAGRIKSRPSTQRDHSVQCEGWQYHLDDDVYRRSYVHTRLGDYRDQRTFLGADLTKFRTNGSVMTDGGAITIGYHAVDNVASGDCVGVTLDLGPGEIGKRVVMTWVSSNNVAGLTCTVRTSDSENPLAGVAGTDYNDLFTFAMNTGTSGTSNGTAATGRRYMHVYLTDPVTAYNPIGGDVRLQITGLMTFRDVTYESGNASILKADTVIINARNTATPLLNQTDALVTAGTFSIPEYLTNGSQSPREIMEQINAYENYRLKLGGGDLKTLVYSAKPTVPLYEVGEGSGSQFADASISGEDIYSKVVVEGTGPDGAFLTSTRTQTGTLVDRQGFTRAKVLPIRSAMTQAVADRFGDLWLTEHDTAPFSGKLTAANGIRRLLGGASVPPHAMLLAAGEKIRLAHRLDHDTGGWGRDGRIAGVSYSHDTRSVSIDIDDRRDHFEEVLNRYGILVDQFTG